MQGCSQKNFDGGAKSEPYKHTQETSSCSFIKNVKGVCTQPITNSRHQQKHNLIDQLKKIYIMQIAIRCINAHDSTSLGELNV